MFKTSRQLKLLQKSKAPPCCRACNRECGYKFKFPKHVILKDCPLSWSITHMVKIKMLLRKPFKGPWLSLIWYFGVGLKFFEVGNPMPRMTKMYNSPRERWAGLMELLIDKLVSKAAGSVVYCVIFIQGGLYLRIYAMVWKKCVLTFVIVICCPCVKYKFCVTGMETTFNILTMTLNKFPIPRKLPTVYSFFLFRIVFTRLK